MNYKAITALLLFGLAGPVMADDLAGPAVKLVREKVVEYYASDRGAWTDKYSKDARIYYNTVDRPISVSEAAAGHERSTAPL